MSAVCGIGTRPAGTPRCPSRSAEEDGFVTVAVLGLLGVLVGVAALIATLGAVAVARHRAASLADLAALAGARHLLDGSACAAARGIAGERLEDCRAEGTRVTVQVGVQVGPWGTARARAAAGPSATLSATRQTGN